MKNLLSKSFLFRASLMLFLVAAYTVVFGQADSTGSGVSIVDQVTGYYEQFMAIAMYLVLELGKMIGLKKAVPKYFIVVIVVAVIAIVVTIGGGFGSLKEAVTGVIGSMGVFGLIQQIQTVIKSDPIPIEKQPK